MKVRDIWWFFLQNSKTLSTINELVNETQAILYRSEWVFLIHRWITYLSMNMNFLTRIDIEKLIDENDPSIRFVQKKQTTQSSELWNHFHQIFVNNQQQFSGISWRCWLRFKLRKILLDRPWLRLRKFQFAGLRLQHRLRKFCDRHLRHRLRLRRSRCHRRSSVSPQGPKRRPDIVGSNSRCM